MKKTLAILLILYAFSCNKKANNKSFNKPNNIDVSKIVTNVIKDDSLQKNSEVVVFINLKKSNVVFSESKQPYPPSLNVIYNSEIKHSKINLNELDLKYIEFQNKNVLDYQLDKDLLKEIIVVDESQMKDKLVYRFSFPIFTANNKKAYVKVISYISGNFLDCREYVLSKEIENWKVIERNILFSH